MNTIAHCETSALGAVSRLDNSNPLQAADFDNLLTEIRARRAEIESTRHVPADIVRRLKSIGVYRAIVPRRFGGMQLPLARFCEMVEAFAAADGSVGWVASFAGTTYLGALPMHHLEAIYADGPDIAFAGGLYPVQKAVRVDGGIKINGRWNFASGCMGADLLGVGISIEGDVGPSGGTPMPRLAVLRPDQVEIVDNWQVMGLCGTGSHDLVVRDVVVPEDWTFIRGAEGTSSLSEPVYRFPSLARASLLHASVGLGIAREALDTVIGLAGGKVSLTGAPLPKDRAYVQRNLAHAEARLRASRALLYSEVNKAWSIVEGGGAVPPMSVNLLRLAAIHAGEVAADVTLAACKIAGTTSIALSHPLQRFMRDAHVVSQHAFLGEGHLESAGRMFLGMPAAPGYP